MFNKKNVAVRRETVFSLRDRGVTGFNFKTKLDKSLEGFIAVIRTRLEEIKRGNIKGDVIFFVPPEYAYPVAMIVKSFGTLENTVVIVGTQKVSPEVSFIETNSPLEFEHTGESVSARFADSGMGVRAALNAHSETFDPDAIVKETNAIVSYRILNTSRHLDFNTVAVGETSEERRAGSEVYIPVVQQQLRERLALLRASIDREVLRDAPEKYRELFITESEAILRAVREGELELVIAYEPIWSIGDRAVGRATPKEAKEMLVPMFETLVEMFGLDVALKIRFQYGGSLDAQKAPEFAGIEEIYTLPDDGTNTTRRVRLFYHGGLVGGASYKPGADGIPEAFNRG